MYLIGAFFWGGTHSLDLIPSMGTCIWLTFMVNVGIYTIDATGEIGNSIAHCLGQESRDLAP